MSGGKSVDSDVDRGKGGGINCYFCNDAFEMGQLQKHLQQCGSILEQCPLRCGAWIQRKHKDAHVHDCPKLEKNQSASTTHARMPDPSPPAAAHTWAAAKPLDSCVAYLEKELSNIKMILTGDASERDVQSTELANLRTQLALLEARGEHFLSALAASRAELHDEAARAADWTAQFKHDVANVQLALQELQSQQLSTAMRLERALGGLAQEQRERELLEQAVAQQDRQLRALNALGDAVEYIKNVVEEERERSAASRVELEAEVAEARRSSQQLQQLTALRAQLQHAASERPTTDRLALLEVETAGARADAADQAARLDALARDLRALTKSYLKLRTELADFQTKVSFHSPELGCDDGHLIWRIDNVAARMKDAKESDSVLVSPLFRTSKYGYTLKAEVNLNGIGKWRGRHVTVSLRTAAAPHDPLLEWPCELLVNVVLKDQPANRNQAMDIVKSLTVRRKSSSKRHDYDTADESKPDERAASSDKSLFQLKRQYVFIPHTSLDKFDYIKDDTMFFEIIVKQ